MHNNVAFSTAKDPSLQWFAAYTTPRHEKHVSEALAERDIETFLPLYKRFGSGRKVRPSLWNCRCFPVTCSSGSLAREEDVYGSPGVLSIVGSAKEPWPLPPSEIEALRLGAQMGKTEPHPYLKIGERVRVEEWSMAGVEGMLLRKKNDFRFVLTLEAIMRSVAIEVDADDLELVDQPSKAISLAGAAFTEVSSN